MSFRRGGAGVAYHGGRKIPTMTHRLAAAFAGLAALCAQAQGLPPPLLSGHAPLVVTATRASSPSPTLRDAVVITRDDIEAAGPLSLGELLERRAGLELRATGGPGQPQGL